MSLKQSIVVVNEFSVPTQTGGTRGSTPGRYVLRYMARKGATEPIAPIRRQRIDDYTLRYMARASAVQRATSRPDLVRELSGVTGLGGVAFGYGSFALSDQEIREASNDLQSLSEAGHTVMKTVVSLDHEYLRKHQLVPEDLQVTRRGDYRGQIDQLKLHLAMMNGLTALGREYDDLRYVGVIQVDTQHVHAHLAMVDAGEGRRAADGTQKGKISQRGLARMRRGIDSYLDEKQTVRHMSSAVSYERQNISGWVKRWAAERIGQESGPQFLLACLPADRTKWRAGSNERSMRKPNRLLREMVEDRLAQPDSGMELAMDAIRRYADERAGREGLDLRERERLVGNGRERIVQRSMNGVYGLLRGLPSEKLNVRTPFYDAMGLDLDDLRVRTGRKRLDRSADGSDDTMDMERFATAVRTYASRLEDHQARRGHYHDLVRYWDLSFERGQTTTDARVLRDHWQTEEEYHGRLVSKYRTFLGTVRQGDAWYERWREVDTFGRVVVTLEMMSNDAALKQMEPERAERVGREIYDQAGAGDLAEGPTGRRRFANRLAAARDRYQEKVEDLRMSLAADGLRLSVEPGGQPGEPDQPSVRPGTEHPFEEVKGLDIHQMDYDFIGDVRVGHRARDSFVDFARQRQEKVQAAASYLQATDQAEQLSGLPLAEIEQMNARARELLTQSQPVLRSRLSQYARVAGLLDEERSATVSLDENLAERVASTVRDQVVGAAGLSLEQLEREDEAAEPGL